MLYKNWLVLTLRWRSAFAQDRSFNRFLMIMVGLLATRGRGTLTAAISFFGQILSWSSDYRIFSRSDWKTSDLFLGVIHECKSYIQHQKRIVISLDDTGIHKSSRKIKQVSLMRDPLGPKYRPNLINGIRCLHVIAHIPSETYQLGSTGISIGFELSPPPKKPKKKASEDEWKEYRIAQKTRCLSVCGANLICNLRKDFDSVGLLQTILCVVDGGYTNKNFIQRMPETVDMIGRVRKDIRICLPAEENNKRKIYGATLPTPETIRSDDIWPIQNCECFYGKRMRNISFKEINNILWQNSAGKRRMRLIIVMPTPYKQPGHKKLRYNEPAYLITTDLYTPAEELIQAYFDRWEIEVLHRDLKTHVGLGQVQLWSENSVVRIHSALVAAYSMLKLASIKAFGSSRTVDYHELPRWRVKKDMNFPRKPSAHDILTKLRADLAENQGEGPLKPSEIHAAA